jgi:hypothetical protein
MFNISGFRSSIEKNGVLRTNRFIVFFNLPTGLQKQIGEYGFEDGLISLRCETAQLPGLNLATIDQPRIGWGPTEGVPHNLAYSEITLTFLMDAQSKIHRLFYDWLNTIVNFQGSRGQSSLDRSWDVGSNKAYAYEVGYKDNYTTDVLVSVYDNYSTGDEGGNAAEYGNNPVMNVRMFKAYPKALPNIDLSWGANDELIRLSIPFGFSDFTVDYPESGSSFKAGSKIGRQKTNLVGPQPKPATPETVANTQNVIRQSARF